MAKVKGADLVDFNGPDAFREIQKLKTKYLSVVQGVVTSGSTEDIKYLADIEKVLGASGVQSLYDTLHYKISESTKKELGVVDNAFSLDKFKKVLEYVNKVYDAQSKQSTDYFVKHIKKLEKILLQKDVEKQRLNKNITELLEYSATLARTGADKARITAKGTKKNFEAAADLLKALEIQRLQTPQNPKEVNAKKLQAAFWGEKVNYFNEY